MKQPFSIEVQHERVSFLLAEIQKRAGDMRKVMSAVGQEAIRSFEQNFEAQGRYSVVGSYIGGDNKWEPLSPTTEKIKEKKGKKPPYSILQESGRLADSITSQAKITIDQNSVTIGTNLEYAPIHEYGAEKGEYGSIILQIDAHKRKSKKGNEYDVRGHQRRVPNPMFKIPARPYLTIHPDNMQTIVDDLSNYLLGDIE